MHGRDIFPHVELLFAPPTVSSNTIFPTNGHTFRLSGEADVPYLVQVALFKPKPRGTCRQRASIMNMPLLIPCLSADGSSAITLRILQDNAHHVVKTGLGLTCKSGVQPQRYRA
jgi:hypothetical protein